MVNLCSDNLIIGKAAFREGGRCVSAPDKSIDSRLLASAKAEFLRNGFLKAELKTICGSAEITTGAVYKGKEELFCAVVRDTVNALERFLAERSDVDFSALSDRQIYDSWIMTFDAMQPMFKLLYRYRDTFYLLIDKATGTRYEDFSHEYVTKMSYAYEQYYNEARRRGLARAEVSREEFHALISSFWTCVCEPIVHGMSWEQIEEHCRVVCRFFNWKEVILLRKGDETDV